MPRQLTDQDWILIDEDVLSGRKLVGMKKIDAITQCGVHAALTEFYKRFKKLAVESPEKFQCNLQDYWNGFYS